MDRTYCRQKRNAVHVFATWTRVPGRARTLCDRNVTDPELFDRVPVKGHLCEICSRMIVAATDVEEATSPDSPNL